MPAEIVRAEDSPITAEVNISADGSCQCKVSGHPIDVTTAIAQVVQASQHQRQIYGQRMWWANMAKLADRHQSILFGAVVIGFLLLLATVLVQPADATTLSHRRSYAEQL